MFNGGRTIGRCLASVSRSAHPRRECIVVDDKSDDDTLAIAEAFDVRVIRSERRRGAAHARNLGAAAATGEILLFLDADVEIYPDCLERVAGGFELNPEISALFGSYDDRPACPNFLSQYKNLFHHFIHQASRPDATTFWSACGAVKRSALSTAGGFDENCRMMEDIELGQALVSRGLKIRLIKDLQVKHLKRYSFAGLLKSDFFDRAIPWTVLMLKNKRLADDLNLQLEHKTSAAVLFLLLVMVVAAFRFPWLAIFVPVPLAAFFLLNRSFYSFFRNKRGALFMLRTIPLHFLYYVYSTLGFGAGSLVYLSQKLRRGR